MKRPDGELVRAIVKGMDHETVLAILRACRAQSTALDHADQFYPSPELRQAAAKLRAVVPVFEAANAQGV